MAAEQVLESLDSYWFETTIFTNKTPSNSHHPISQTKVVKEMLPLDTDLLEAPTLEVRSFSDQNLGSSSTESVFSYSQSPNSVLTPQKLRTIPSGRDVREFSSECSGNIHEKECTLTKKKQSHYNKSHRRRLTRKGRTSKSLTELEFQELKGFMDLGFVFSEEDKDSRLVSLIPGLQRLGRDQEDAGEGDDEEQQNIDDETLISNKPYLSDAWGFYDQREIRNPLRYWKVPARGNEIDMKQNLMFWARTVASIVR